MTKYTAKALDFDSFLLCRRTHTSQREKTGLK